jgi:hypothetical protein
MTRFTPLQAARFHGAMLTFVMASPVVEEIKYAGGND